MPEMDPIKSRLVSLSFKQATQGLSPEEEAEMQRLKQQLALQNAAGG